MMVVDHNEPYWHKRYLRKNRENGAVTYSRDIVKFHIPVWEAAFKEVGYDLDKIVISTCPLLDRALVAAGVEVVVQYLHTYSYDDPFKEVKVVIAANPQIQKILFVTAYANLAAQLNMLGVSVVYLPMMIDEEALSEVDLPVERHGNRIIYFGNITRSKRRLYYDLKRKFEAAGWVLDTISKNRFNHKESVADQAAAWEIVKNYQFGIGVGRCALEMYQLGLSVIIAGAEFGGVVVDEIDAEAQLKANLNGRVITFDRTPDACMRMLPVSRRINASAENLMPRIKTAINTAVKEV